MFHYFKLLFKYASIETTARSNHLFCTCQLIKLNETIIKDYTFMKKTINTKNTKEF